MPEEQPVVVELGDRFTAELPSQVQVVRIAGSAMHVDEGITGVGETDTNPWVARECIRARGTHCMGLGLEEMLIGEDPLEPQAVWKKLYTGSKMTGRRGAVICALGAIDMALWDIRGKALDQPIYKLLGGATKDFITPYASLIPGGLSFITSSASFIDAFAFLSSKLTGTEQRTWWERARLLANYNWNDRHPDTNLLAHTPNETGRWDGFRSATTTPAIYVPALLRAYEFTGDVLFRDQALTYLRSWAEYAYDADSGSFWGSLELDGTPAAGPWASGGYAQFEPRGLVDLWAPEFITAQYTPDAAKAYALNWLQSVAPYENGDVTGDGQVTLLDFSRFKHEYYEGPATDLAVPDSVPEPAMFLLLPLAAMKANHVAGSHHLPVPTPRKKAGLE